MASGQKILDFRSRILGPDAGEEEVIILVLVGCVQCM